MKDWIQKNLTSSVKKKLNGRRCRKEWFKNTDNLDKYDLILSNTSFLDEQSPSLSQRVWHIMNDVHTPVYCKSGSKKLVKFISFTKGYLDYSSNKAAQQSDEVKQKVVETNVEKYGKSYYTQTDEFKEKAVNTWTKKYGVDNPSKSKEIKSKKIKTTLNNYNVKYPQQSSQVRKKTINTVRKKYGVSNVMKNSSISERVSNTKRNTEFDRFFEKIFFSKYINPQFTKKDYYGINHSYTFKCKKCKKNFKTVLRGGKVPRCYDCYPIQNTSKGETEIFDYIEDIVDDGVIKNSKSIIPPYELDIYIPEKKVAIEFNGLYYHSEISGGKDRNYHLQKTELCEKKGIHLIHIFEDEWILNQDIIKRRLKTILGENSTSVYGRKCEIREINSKQSRSFLNKYHLQGSVQSNVKLGLYFQEELISVMTFGNRKIFENTNDWELLRFASKKRVVGGFSKLLSYFEGKHSPNKLISYALRNWSYSDNNVYQKMGFKLINKGTPSYHYIKNGIRYNRIKFQKHKLKDKLETFDPQLTEWKNMQLNGWDRIWDCGSLKYIKTYK